MHYTPNGTEQLDQSYIGVVFADPQTVKKRVHGGALANRRLSIPPHAENHEVTSSRKLSEDQLLISMSPHMHLRGKSFRFEATYPDGTQEILLDVPNTIQLADALRAGRAEAIARRYHVELHGAL